MDGLERTHLFWRVELYDAAFFIRLFGEYRNINLVLGLVVIYTALDHFFCLVAKVSNDRLSSVVLKELTYKGRCSPLRSEKMTTSLATLNFQKFIKL